MAIQRNAKKKFVFKDGTVIPAGAKIGAPTYFVQRDPLVYDKPDEFDPLRFSRMQDEVAGAATKYQMVST